jgi:hypothetical protein
MREEEGGRREEGERYRGSSPSKSWSCSNSCACVYTNPTKTKLASFRRE